MAKKLLKDKKAEIYKGESYSEPGGMPRKKYRPISKAPLWCYTKQLSQNTVFEAAAYGQEETRLFVFNYSAIPAVYNLIKYRGAWYEITRVDTTDDYKGDLYIYAKDCPRGGIPGDDDILPYEDETE